MPAKRTVGRIKAHKSKTDRVLAQNLQKMIDESPFSSVASWAKDKNLEPRNIQRILAGDQSPSVTLLDELARKARVEYAWQLLVPNLDINNPPAALSELEKKLYADLQEKARQLVLPKQE